MHALMHALPVIGYMVGVAKLEAQVVRVQHRRPARLQEPVVPHGTDVRPGPEKNGEIAVKGPHPADALAFAGIKLEFPPLFDDARVRRFIEMPNQERLRELLKKADEICWEGLQVEEES